MDNTITQKHWLLEVASIYKGKATEKEYTRYNNAFIQWFERTYGRR